MSSVPYFKVLTEPLPSRTILRSYQGICLDCLHEVEAALHQGGPTGLHELLMTKSGVDFSHAVNAVIEVQFEAERSRQDHRLPRRTSSVHVFRDLDAARSFKAEFRSASAGIYEVRIGRLDNNITLEPR